MRSKTVKISGPLAPRINIINNEPIITEIDKNEDLKIGLLLPEITKTLMPNNVEQTRYSPRTASYISLLDKSLLYLRYTDINITLRIGKTSEIILKNFGMLNRCDTNGITNPIIFGINKNAFSYEYDLEGVQKSVIRIQEKNTSKIEKAYKFRFSYSRGILFLLY